MKCLVISTSLNLESNSAVLAQKAFKYLEKSEGVEVSYVDLRDISLPMCNGGSAYEDDSVKRLSQQIGDASGLLIATPIYNFSVSAGAKNLLELTGSAWRNKVVGFLCAAGARMSYMSVMPYANSLMLDYRCTIVPDFVYASEEDFESDVIVNEQVELRLGELVRKFAHFTRALKDF